MHVRVIVFICLIIFSAPSQNVLAVDSAQISKSQERQPIQDKKSKKLDVNQMDSLQSIEEAISRSQNPWIREYLNILNYENLSEEIASLESKIKSSKHDNILEYQSTLDLLYKQRQLLENFNKSPYNDLLAIPPLPDMPKVTNPFLIVNARSYIKSLESIKLAKLSNRELLQEAINFAKHYQLIALDSKKKEIKSATLELKNVNHMMESLESALVILDTTDGIFFKKLDELSDEARASISAQLLKLRNVIMTLLSTIILAFIIKFAFKHYMSDSRRIYTISKAINFLNILIIAIVLLFFYIENVTYIVAILGFASAGLAIAMKDWFMSILGWLVIMIGGSIHVGDRIRVSRDGNTYVGDVLDISMLNIILYEDITRTTYKENQRAGRIIFIPNNYIFTTLIANYTHAGINTIWDGVHLVITFDSNHTKAVQIATDIAKKYSKGYTELTKKRMEKLRDRFSLRNINLEPRAFSVLESYGINISVWYQANSYSSMTLHSTISRELIDAFMQEDDITISYPATKIVLTGGDGRGNKESRGREDRLD